MFHGITPSLSWLVNVDWLLVKARSPKENASIHKGFRFKLMAVVQNNIVHHNCCLGRTEYLVYLGSQSVICDVK